MAKKKQIRINSSRWYDIPQSGNLVIGIYRLEFQEVEVPPEPKYKVGDTFDDRDGAAYTITGPGESRFGDNGEHDGYDYPMLVKAIGTKAVWHDYWSERSLEYFTKTN